MGFWVASADIGGSMVTASQQQLSPAPAEVSYPTELQGTTRETADGMLIVQQPSRDARKYSWIWRNLRLNMVTAENQWRTIEGLRSRLRAEAGMSPYVYLKEDETGRLQKYTPVTLTVASATSTTLTPTSASGWTTNMFARYELEVMTGTGAGQKRIVTSNTTGVITVPAWTVTPTAGATVLVRQYQAVWWRCRVIETLRGPSAGGGSVHFEESRMTFVIDDPTFNRLD